MRLAARVLAVAAAGALVGCTTRSDALTDVELTAARNAVQEFTAAMEAGDLDRAVALHTDDAHWMPPGEPAVSGREQLRAHLSRGPRIVRFVMTSEQTDGRSDIAYDRGSYIFSGLFGADTISARGKYVSILRRQADGSWLIALDIWNQDAPPGAPRS